MSIVTIELRASPDDDVTATACPSAHDVSFTDLENEDGYGSFELNLADPIASNDLRHLFGHISIDGGDEFTFALEAFHRVAAAQSGDLNDRVISWAGRGILSAVLSRALVYPALGVDVLPVVHQRPFNWTSPEYDDSGAPWTPATVISGMLTGTGMIVPDFPDPSAALLWAADGDPYPTTAAGGNCWFRQPFNFPLATAGLYRVHFVADNGGALYIDGGLIMSLVPGPIENFTRDNVATVQLTVGDHLVAVLGTNLPQASDNPGFIAWAIYDVDAEGNDATLREHSDASALMIEYQDDPPGMTIGQVLRLCKEEAETRGVEFFDLITLTFDDDLDTNGDPWDEVSDVSTAVKTDVYTFVRELCATYCDVWFTSGTLELNATAKGGRAGAEAFTLQGPTARDPATATIVELVQEGTG